MIQDIRAMLAVVPSWAAAGPLAIAVAFALLGLRRLLLARLGRMARATENQVDDLLVTVLERTRRSYLVLLALIAGASILPLGAPVDRALHVILVVGTGAQLGLWLATLLTGALRLWVERAHPGDGGVHATLSAVRFLVLLVMWSGLGLLVLSNLGVDVTALVAGLGVGGVAVALAVQNILGDLFASLSIVLDRPFTIGDFIVVGDAMGTVERIGLKTTRVRSLSGEELIISNGNLLAARIHNYRQMPQRRVVFSVGVTYDTPAALVREIPQLIRDTISATQPTRFDRAHFKAFGDSALVFEAVYFVLSADYNQYMDIQQEINLALMDRFAERGIEFAFPTQTLYLARARRAEGIPEPAFGRSAGPGAKTPGRPRSAAPAGG